MLQMNGKHSDPQSYRPLPSLSSAAGASPFLPALPQRLPSLTRVRGRDGIPSNHNSTSGSSAASSPESSPCSYAVTQGVKRMRVAHATLASVHPSTLAQQQFIHHEEDVFLSGAYKSQRKPAQNATVSQSTLFDYHNLVLYCLT